MAASISVSPTSVIVGKNVTATWSGIAAPAAKDWIGLYLKGAADTAVLNWVYVSGTRTPVAARASGYCPIQIPVTTKAGTTYELRLFANDSYTRLAKSGALTVTPLTLNQAVTDDLAVISSLVNDFWKALDGLDNVVRAMVV